MRNEKRETRNEKRKRATRLCPSPLRSAEASPGRLTGKFLVPAIAIALATIGTSAAQRIPDPKQGNPRLTQWGVLDGNRVRTLYANHGEIARWPDQPSGEWPRGSGHSYVDGVAFIVSVRTRDGLGQLIKPQATNYREFIDRDPVTSEAWGWAPVPGYSNPRQESPARSDDPGTWPSEWPDRPIDWAGQWNGFFGRGVQNADVETYFVYDDSPDREWAGPEHQFFPCAGDTSRGGIGVEVAARGFQWNHPLAQDVIFWLYEITNECDVDYDEVFFSQYIDWGVGGTDDSGDDEGAYSTRLDLAFAWDYDGVGTPARWGPVGTAGYAFLESPGISSDDVDNDDDGITDESRDSGPGQLIEGQGAILGYATSNYNLQNFNTFYLGIEGRPAYQVGRWWTGDEDMDWLGFSDINENGIWDPDEPINDDVGEDGLSPTSPNYPGRDIGEGDGRPTSGEPNFDALDKDESDQIGLTGFAVFNVHDYELLDDAQNFDIFSRAVPPFEDILLEGGRNLGMFFSSGPFPLKAGQTERFSMALLFAEKDYTDPSNISNSALARKKETVQQIYNADYRFARPPNKPLVEVIPGDGMVTLTWDDLAEQSFDPFLREFDFEGYMIFRSTEPNFEENLTITDAFGNRIFQKPIAQFDLVNGLRGPHPVSVNGVQFNLGTDSGLKHTFIDRDVRNGQTYYYAVVAYDRGLVARDADSTVVTTPDGMVRGLAPSLTSAVIKNDVAGNVVADVNTGFAVPRTPAAGYIGPAFDNVERTVTGTGTIDIEIVAPGLVTEAADYELTFQNPSLWQNESEVEYELINKTAGTTVVSDVVTNGIAEIAPFEGFVIDMVSPTSVTVTDGATRLSDEQTTFRPVVRPASVVPLVQSRFIAVPDDFVIHFTEGISDTSSVLGFGMVAIPTPFYIVNLEGERQEFIVIEENPDLRNGQYDHGERIVLAMGVEPGLPPIRAAGAWRVSWSIEVVPPDPVLEPDIPVIPPAAGSTLAFETSKPFQTGDRVAFSVKPPELDDQLAANQMDDIFVVPNPYVATSEFEPPNVYRAGRGERRIYFMNLPRQCTIRIYTISGQLVQTLEHESSIDDGQLSWDLVQRDGMTISYGIYLYHVDAPGVGEFVGRFGVIK